MAFEVAFYEFGESLLPPCQPRLNSLFLFLGSRKTSGQTGMCGGVRGVGAGGIVSSAYCLLFKLGTLKLTRKQVNGLINHTDSPYIRGLGFMYLRFDCKWVGSLHQQN